MEYPKFMELSAEMKVQVIRKCYPIPYVRLRQSCRQIDEVSEQSRKWLGIYCYRQQPHLYLTNSLSIWPFSQSEEYKQRDLKGPHVAVNYGKKDGDHNFLVPMTSKNISKIRGSLSGFYFFEVSLINDASPEDYEENKKFDDALTYFLEVACDLNFRYVSVRNLTTAQVELVLSTGGTRGLTIYSTRDTTVQNLKDISQMDTVKKMPYGYYHMSNAITDITEELIQEIARGKRTVYLFLSCLPHEIATKAYSSLYRIWNKEANFPKYFSLYFIEDSNFFYYATGYRMIGVLHIKQLAELQLNFKEHNDSRKKYGIWIAKYQAKNQWIIVTLRRIQWGTKTQVYICLRAQLSKETFITTLCLFIDISYPGHAYDYSILYEKMTKMETEEEIKDEYSKSTEFMLRFYRRTYRRTILNVLCEMVMEWWNGPRWILELTKRKPIERRSPFVDLGYVLFQELLCPIYQYCTVPNI